MLVFDARLQQRIDTCVGEQTEAIKNGGVNVRVALLVGCRVDDGADIFVQHLSRCPLPATAGDEADEISLSSNSPDQSPRAQDPAMKLGAARSRPLDDVVDADWICHNARQSIKMLPGGFDVVGLMLLSDKKSATRLQPQLLKALRKLIRMSAQVNWMGLRPLETSMAFVTVDVPLGSTTAYQVNVTDNSQQMSSTRLQYNSIQWKELSCQVALNLPYQMSLPREVESDHFRKQFISLIRPLASQILSRSVCVFNGKQLAPTDQLVTKNKEPTGTSGKKGKGGKASKKVAAPVDSGAIECDLLLGVSDTPETTPPKTINILSDDTQVAGQMGVRGTLCCSAVVPVRCTAAQAHDALNMDLLRSIYARTELHYESMAVIENENLDESAIHQLPRRVFAPAAPGINYCDYLFDADLVDDAVKNFADIMDLEVDEDDVCDDNERVMDTSMLSDLNVQLPLIGAGNASGAAGSSSGGVDFKSDREYIEQLVGRQDDADRKWVLIVIAVLIAVIGAIVAAILARAEQ